MDSSENSNEVDKNLVDSLIKNLDSEDGLTRQRSRHELVRIGKPALSALIEAFEIKGDFVHWEVAKALSQIGSPEAAKVLVDAIEEKEFSIRWIASEGLIHIGYDALMPLLEALKKRSDSIWLREGAHHVLHDLISRKLIDDETIQITSQVLDALNHVKPEEETHSATIKAIDQLKTR